MEDLEKDPNHASRSFTPSTANDAPAATQDIEKVTPDIVEAVAEGDDPAKAQPVDEFDVWWEDPEDQDPENPQNWTNKKKWSNIAVLSAITFLTYV